jgi:formylglycine-generating enzyme required for sulfatase activity
MLAMRARSIRGRWATSLAAACIAAAPAVAAASGPSGGPETAVKVDLGSGVVVSLLLVKAGSFEQGSPDAERGRASDETRRSVTLTRDFYIGKYPVTRGQFARFVEETRYRTEAERGSSGGSGWNGHELVQKKEYSWRSPGFSQTDEHPVTLVTYDDALAFAGWLSGKSGRTVTLPTEAQWEYAARAGTKTRYYAGDGDESADAIGWFKDNAGQGTRPVGQKQANPWGLYDMAGNVWQWCQDYYGPYASGPVTDPLSTSSPASEDKARRVLRGGSWLKDRKNLRSAARYRNTPGSRNADNGFRVVASIEKAAPVPAPVPPPASDPVQAPSSKGSTSEAALGGAFFCGALGVIGAFFVGAFFLLRALIRGGRGAVSFRTGMDGFWIQAPGHAAGSRIAYRYRTVQGTFSGSAVYPGGASLFVYTGLTPLSVQVDSGSGGGGGGWRSSSSRSSAWRSSSEPAYRQEEPAYRQEEPAYRQEEPAFRGYPSAY